MKIQFSVVCLAVVVVAVLGTQGDSHKKWADESAEAVMLLKKASRALEPYKEELVDFSSQLISHYKQRLASDTKTRSAAVDKSRALGRQGADLMSKVGRALSPMKKEATELLSKVVRTSAAKSGLTRRQERAVMYDMIDTLEDMKMSIDDFFDWLVTDNYKRAYTGGSSDGWTLLKKASRALAPYEEELINYSSRLVSHHKRRTSSDPKARLAAVGNDRALERQGLDLISQVERSLSPIQNDATEFLSKRLRIGGSKSSLSRGQERAFVQDMQDMIENVGNSMKYILDMLIGNADPPTERALCPSCSPECLNYSVCNEEEKCCLDKCEGASCFRLQRPKRGARRVGDANWMEMQANMEEVLSKIAAEMAKAMSKLTNIKNNDNKSTTSSVCWTCGPKGETHCKTIPPKNTRSGSTIIINGELIATC